MQAHNYFTIESGGEKQTAHNTLGDIGGGYRTGLPVTAFVAVLSGGVVKHVLPADVVGYNADISNGRLYVSRGAVLDVSVAQEGECFDAVGFTPDENGSRLINCAAFAPVTAEAGKPVYITGTLYLDAAASSGAFVAGDNRLIRALLGLEGLESGACTVAAGDSRHPNVPVYTDASRLRQAGGCTAMWSANSLTISGSVGQAFETYICYHGTPVMRFYDSRTSGTAPFTGRTDEGGYVYAGDGVLSVMNVTAGGSPVSEYDAYTVPERFAACCPAVYPAALPYDATVLGEPTGCAAAVSGKGQTAVLRADGYTVKEIMRVPTANAAAVASDGTLFVLEGGTLRAFVPNGGAYAVIECGLSAVTAAAVTGTGTFGAHFVCVIAGGMLYQYRLQGGVWTELFAPRAAAGGTLHAFTPRLIVMLLPSGFAAALSSSGESAAIRTALEMFTTAGTLTVGYNGMLFFTTPVGSAVCDLFGGGGAEGGVGAVFFKHAVLSGGGMWTVRQDGSLGQVPSDTGFDGVTGGASLGRYTLLVRDGRAEFIYESPGGMIVYLPGRANTTVSAMTVKRAAPRQNAVLTAVLKFNGT